MTQTWISETEASAALNIDAASAIRFQPSVKSKLFQVLIHSTEICSSEKTLTRWSSLSSWCGAFGFHSHIHNLFISGSHSRGFGYVPSASTSNLIIPQVCSILLGWFFLMIASSHKCNLFKSDFGAFQTNQKFAFWHLYCQKSQEIKPIHKDDVCLLKHSSLFCPPEWMNEWMNEYVERCRQMQLNTVQDVLSSVWSARLVTPPGSDPHTPAAEILPSREPTFF